MKLLLALLLAPCLLLAQGIPSSGNSKLWEMRKKTQQRSAQRSGSYLEQMNAALAAGDNGGAETALKSAIAQGTLTQAQVNDARGRINAQASQQAQAAAAQAASMAQSSGTSSGGGSAPSAPAGAKAVTVKFDNGGIQSIRIFNVGAGGAEAGGANAGSPGNCQFARCAAGLNDTVNGTSVNVLADTGGVAGTYGYEVKFINIVNRHLFKDHEVGNRRSFKGTFTIPAGKTEVVIRFGEFRWDNNVMPDVTVGAY